MTAAAIATNDLLTSTAKIAQANAVSSSSPSSTNAAATASSALASLSSNYNSFLTLLTTQLKNQNPTSPMDTSQFTSELATFSGVQQQVNINTNLGQLISLTQSGQMTADNGLIGQSTTFTSPQIPLQNGTGSISFNTASASPVAIAISDTSGHVVRTVQANSVAGVNNWSWDGKDNAGNTLPDGAYGIAVQAQDTAGNVTSVPFTANGTVTGVSRASNGDVQLQVGAETVAMSKVASVKKAA